MTWDGKSNIWAYRKFRGSGWQKVSQEDARQNVKNTYRVLMTRAREALVIWVPPGDSDDPTRSPQRMDDTATFLRECGIKKL
jgi:hypothetical protein